jgi:hypothetical protein
MVACSSNSSVFKRLTQFLVDVLLYKDKSFL